MGCYRQLYLLIRWMLALTRTARPSTNATSMNRAPSENNQAPNRENTDMTHASLRRTLLATERCRARPRRFTFSGYEKLKTVAILAPASPYFYSFYLRETIKH